MKEVQLLRQRALNYHRTRATRVRTLDQARAFVEEMGFCFFWPIKGIEMPSLFHAIAGRVRSVPREHDDPDNSKCWGWKDESLGQHWWYYGKLLRRRATIVSLDLLPHFYACSESYGSLDDYLQLYEDGLMTAEAKSIYEALLENGPLDTIRLRREARMAAQSAKARFDRALVELQVGLKVLPIAVARTGAWNYAFAYEILQRHFPDLPKLAKSIKRSEAGSVHWRSSKIKTSGRSARAKIRKKFLATRLNLASASAAGSVEVGVCCSGA